MEEVIFTYQGNEINVQCTTQDTMKAIFKKFQNKANINDLDNIFFLYGGKNILDYNIKFNDLANPVDKSRHKMNILARKCLINDKR